MIILALLSGLINISSQAVYQKVVSMTAGDLYTTFLAVTLTFIFGSAVGSFYGNRIRGFLPWIELLSGLYALLIRFLLDAALIGIDVPMAMVILGLLLPAIALGTHIPLYSYYLKKIKFGFIYSLYHFGAILGLFIFEWHFVNSGSTKGALFVVGVSQVILGLLLVYLKNKSFFKIESLNNLKKLQIPFRIISLIFISSLISFYFVFWALKTQVMLTEGFRLHATSISAAVFFWMSLAGVSSQWIKRISPVRLIELQLLSIMFLMISFPRLSLGIVDLYSGSVNQYILVSFMLSLYLTCYTFFSSSIFISATNQCRLAGNDIDYCSGRLGLIAAFGNIFGMLLGGGLASELWFPIYFIVPAVIILTASLALNHNVKSIKTYILPTLTIICFIFFGSKPQKENLFDSRVLSIDRDNIKVVNSAVYSSPFSAVGLFSIEAKKNAGDSYQAVNGRRIYVVDGHWSHDVYSGMEFVAGLVAARYTDSPLNSSLVIGVGSGQAAWGVSSISRKTDLVEISPAVIENLKKFEMFNRSLLKKDSIQIYLQDGMSFLSNCSSSNYDLIVNTATYPANFNAAKLYSDELVALAKSCLAPNGLYQTYFDNSTAITIKEVYEFLAPIHKHFKYVDIFTRPYPLVIASNVRRNISPINSNKFVDKNDWDFLKKRNPTELNEKCVDVIRNVSKPNAEYSMSTIDRAILESNSLKNSIAAYDTNRVYLEIEEFFIPEGKESLKLSCE